MFCQKCGTKAIEGASFCQKCGAKLVKEKEVLSGPEPMTEPVPKPAETPRPSAIPEITSPAPQNQQAVNATEISMAQEAYDRLTAAAATYPKLKRIEMRKNPRTASACLSAQGSLTSYVFSLDEEIVVQKISWATKWSIELAHLAVVVCGMILLSLLEVNEFLWSALLLLNVLFCTFISFLYYKESSEIIAYIGRTINCKFNSPSSLPILITCAWNLVVTIELLRNIISLV